MSRLRWHPLSSIGTPKASHRDKAHGPAEAPSPGLARFSKAGSNAPGRGSRARRPGFSSAPAERARIRCAGCRRRGLSAARALGRWRGCSTAARAPRQRRRRGMVLHNAAWGGDPRQCRRRGMVLHNEHPHVLWRRCSIRMSDPHVRGGRACWPGRLVSNGDQTAPRDGRGCVRFAIPRNRGGPYDVIFTLMPSGAPSRGRYVQRSRRPGSGGRRPGAALEVARRPGASAPGRGGSLA
jgi:hypothetical protein